MRYLIPCIFEKKTMKCIMHIQMQLAISLGEWLVAWGWLQIKREQYPLSWEYTNIMHAHNYLSSIRNHDSLWPTQCHTVLLFNVWINRGGGTGIYMYKINHSRYKVLFIQRFLIHVLSNTILFFFPFSSLPYVPYTLLSYPFRLLCVRCLRHLLSVYHTFFINIDFTLELIWQV